MGKSARGHCFGKADLAEVAIIFESLSFEFVEIFNLNRTDTVRFSVVK